MPTFTDAAAMAQSPIWRELAPDLHVGDAAFITANHKPLAFDPAALAEIQQRVLKEGYFQLPPPDWALDLRALARGVAAVTKAGFPPVYAYMYDEAWLVFAQIARVLEALLGDTYMMMPAFWAWHVDGSRETAGWPPHRDHGPTALMPDRSAKLLSIWIPLSNATPLNGCMYLVPADRDPLYGVQMEKEAAIDLQNIRALPAAAGSVLGWTQAVYHWGSRPNTPVSEPRISMSVEFQRGDQLPVNEPLLDPEAIPGLTARARLIVRQLIQYKAFYPVAPELLAFAKTNALRSVNDL
ncbi:MAG: phytanoyl-CoA dioxygenase family protein [Rhodospirillaceae bacterium]